MSRRLALLGALAAVAVTLLTGAPRALSAQPAPPSDIHGPTDLSASPKLVSAAAMARLIARSYPEAMRRQHQGGQALIEFVVGRDGKVEPGSITVVDASAPTLATAAKLVVEKMEFVPGRKDGQPVRARVQQQIVYRP